MENLNTFRPNNTTLSYNQLDDNWEEIQKRTGKGWNDLVSDVTIRAGTNAPTMDTFRGGLVLPAFPSNTIAECFANFHMGHDYVPSTMVYPHVHWTVNTNSGGTVRWGVEYTYAQREDGGTGVQFPEPQILYINVTIPENSQYTHFVSESIENSGIDGTGLDTDAVIITRYFRDAEHPSDTFPDQVFLLTVDVHYESNVASTPSRFPPFR